MIERRSEPRQPLAPECTRATIRPGRAVSIIDLSSGGALLQASRPLRPGMQVHLQVVTSERSVSVTGHVVRCAVWSLEGDEIMYRGAVRFDRPIESWWEAETQVGSSVPEAENSLWGDEGQSLPAAFPVRCRQSCDQ
jgi:hypothetical protein